MWVKVKFDEIVRIKLEFRTYDIIETYFCTFLVFATREEMSQHFNKTCFDWDRTLTIYDLFPIPDTKDFDDYKRGYADGRYAEKLDNFFDRVQFLRDELVFYFKENLPRDFSSTRTSFVLTSQKLDVFMYLFRGHADHGNYNVKTGKWSFFFISKEYTDYKG